ncbi:hypothetical protein N9N28_18120 [Rubripirellula amarantea]|nr:hypothetical protein [Rubripirellula amarantea]
MKKVLLGCGIMFGLLVVVFLGGAMWLGMMIESGNMPDTTVVAGNKLSKAARDAIDKAVTLRPDETIVYFYSMGLLSWEEDGNLITNQRVVSYSQFEGELFVDEADYEQFEEVYTSFFESWLDDSAVTIVTKQGDEFTIYLSNESDLDHAAVEYIERQSGLKAENVAPVE